MIHATHASTGEQRFNATAGGSQLLWSRNQIVNLLKRFIREERAVSVNYAAEKRVLVTRALRIDADLDRLYFEYGDHKSGNANLFRSKEINFSVEDGEGKSQFVSPRARDVLLEGQPVFHVPIPDRMVQADRRAHDRIKIPDIAAPIVIFNLPDGRKAEGRLADLSTGGIGVIGVAADFDLLPGTMMRNCVIELDNNQDVYVDVEIRHAQVFINGLGQLEHRVGFRLLSRPQGFSDLLDAFTIPL